MEKIAEVTGGMYVMVQDMNELSTFFKRQVLLSRFIAKFAHGKFLNFSFQEHKPHEIVVLQVQILPGLQVTSQMRANFNLQ